MHLGELSQAFIKSAKLKLKAFHREFANPCFQEVCGYIVVAPKALDGLGGSGALVKNCLLP
jgi:hypothetical protein